MPFRFRKSFRLAKGVRLNLTGKGASVSTRVGPFSYSTRSARSARSSRSNTAGGGSGCVSLITWPFVLIYQLYRLLFIAIVKCVTACVRLVRWLFAPTRAKISLIVIGALVAVSLLSSALAQLTGK